MHTQHCIVMGWWVVGWLGGCRWSLAFGQMCVPLGNPYQGLTNSASQVQP